MLKIQLILNISVAVMSWKCCPLYVDNQSLLSSSRGERFVHPLILPRSDEFVARPMVACQSKNSAAVSTPSFSRI